ncbi:uncharacterized protein [Phyllobates terribilis]|uniref:uncharacterized protein n=1 Tax=Phyllobates terribilis TaxID=111132 RepID=UPI003CCB1C66
MDGIYGLHPTPAEYSDRALLSSDGLILPSDYQSFITSPEFSRMPPPPDHLIFGSGELASVASAISHERCKESDAFAAIKARIASHPRYPTLLQAYIDCQKVGAPPDIARLLDEIRRENNKDDVVPSFIGADPELDEFMEIYCNILKKYKLDLSRPFDEATAFLNKIESQLGDLCNGAFGSTASDDGMVSSDEEYCSGGGEIDIQKQPREGDRDLKDKLLRRFGSHVGSLKLEFSKKKKKGKLPREARQTLLEWWNLHYKWPYPTEGDKFALAEATGLDPRQINNWFINQRKRHWKPSENMHLALMDNLSAQQFTDGLKSLFRSCFRYVRWEAASAI